MKLAMIIILSVIIAASIGGLTNYLAIKMLFRPLHKIKLGKWNIPFTPGLIPKRHPQIAKQMGRLVEEHLLTTSSLQQKLESPATKKELEEWLLQFTQRVFTSEENMDQIVFNGLKGLDNNQLISEAIATEVSIHLKQMVKKNWNELQGRKLKDIVSIEQDTLEGVLEQLSSLIISKGEYFLQTEDGEQFLKNSLQTTVERLGPLGGMLSLVLPQEKLLEKVMPLLERWIRDPETDEKLQQQLFQLWLEWREQELQSLFNHKLVEEAFASLSTSFSLEEHISTTLQQTVGHLFSKEIKSAIINNIPFIAEAATVWLQQMMPHILGKIRIAAMVEEQILQFSLEKLEKIIRDLAKKELKAITWLGAVLGGTIGLIQAVVFILFL